MNKFGDITTSLFLLTALTAGCRESLPTDSSASLNDAVVELDGEASSVTDKVSGAWTISGVRTLAFAARVHDDGTIGGEWERVNQDASHSSHGDVICVNVIGNQAWIGTLATTGPWAGLEGGFRVIDNGAGANDAPDQASLQVVNQGPGYAQAYCDAAIAFPGLLTVGAGNITIW